MLASRFAGQGISCAPSGRRQRGHIVRAVTTKVRLTRLRRFATWLDAGIAIPGTSLRFGLDPILGLVPGLGDAAGALLAGWIVVEALRLGVSPSTIGRIVLNV